jgi:hypothetical protein
MRDGRSHESVCTTLLLIPTKHTAFGSGFHRMLGSNLTAIDDNDSGVDLYRKWTCVPVHRVFLHMVCSCPFVSPFLAWSCLDFVVFSLISFSFFFRLLRGIDQTKPILNPTTYINTFLKKMSFSDSRWTSNFRRDPTDCKSRKS